jgi:quercetin dioxygenase-like cupin family protein
LTNLVKNRPSSFAPAPSIPSAAGKQPEKRSFKMSTKLQGKAELGQTGDQQLFDAAGVLVQFLVSPEEIQGAICLIRGTMPPGVVVPLHSHPEPEVIYVLEGSLEVFRAKNGSGHGWTTAAAGEVVTVPGGVQHALRNTSSRPTITALVTKSDLYRFFREVAKPFDPNRRPAPPTPEVVQELFAASARYGFWMGSPEENAAIGLQLM